MYTLWRHNECHSVKFAQPDLKKKSRFSFSAPPQVYWSKFLQLLLPLLVSVRSPPLWLLTSHTDSDDPLLLRQQIPLKRHVTQATVGTREKVQTRPNFKPQEDARVKQVRNVFSLARKKHSTSTATPVAQRLSPGFSSPSIRTEAGWKTQSFFFFFSAGSEQRAKYGCLADACIFGWFAATEAALNSKNGHNTGPLRVIDTSSFLPQKRTQLPVWCFNNIQLFLRAILRLQPERERLTTGPAGVLTTIT